jgi:hypothetical protein
MRFPLMLGLAACAIALSGCAGFTVPGLAGNGAAPNSAMQAFLTDPNCAHHDEAHLVTGAAGMPASFSATVTRDCAARPAALAVPAGIAPATQP